MARSKDVRTPEATVSYAADLFEARKRENGSESYGATLIFPKNVSLAALEAAALEAATAEWGDKAKGWIKDGFIKSPFLDGDGKQGKTQEGEQRPELRNSRFIRCTSGAKFKPKIFDRKRDPILDAADCPSGSRVIAVVNAFTWDTEKNGKGITFGISLVQVVHKAEGSEILGGGDGPDPTKFLDIIADEGEAPASTKNGDGAAGLFG